MASDLISCYAETSLAPKDRRLSRGEKMSSEKEQWGSRIGYLMAALGMVIGTGNIWRFPRVVAANGGGAFLIAWTVAMLVYAVPLLMNEMVMGKKTRLGTIGAFRDFAGRKYTWMGIWVCAVCLFLMSYYSVVMGYCVKYFTLSFTDFTANMTTDMTTGIWEGFIRTPVQTILFHLVSIGLGCFVVYKGVTKGIEKYCKILIPVLFALLVFVAFWANTLPGSSQGLQYLFNIDLSYLANPTTWLNAFTQAAWSTGAGWGFIVTYSVYVRKNEDIPNNCLIMGLGDNIGALVAGLAILPAIFALSPSAEAAAEAVGAGNYGMTFIYLFQLFSTMPMGRVISAVFFFCMAAAALTSLFPMIEVGVRNLMDCGLKRKKATLLVCGVGFLIGGFSAWSLDILNNQDWVWALGLMVSGLFFAFAVLKYGVEKIRTEEINGEGADFQVPKWYYNGCMYIIPALVIVMVLWWLVQAIGWYPDSWWNPFEVDNVGTVFVQFGLVIGAGLFLNRWAAKKVGKGPITKEEEV
jgi:NSS family neurotransmitter:Na+ symporter